MTPNFGRIISKIVSAVQENSVQNQRHLSLFRKSKTKENHSPYIILRATKDDYLNILKVMHQSYFPDEPTCRSLDINHNAIIDERMLSYMAHGMSMVARCKYDGSLVGGCLNTSTHSWDPDLTEKFACSVRCPRVRQLLLFDAHLQRLPDVWKRFDVNKVFELVGNGNKFEILCGCADERVKLNPPRSLIVHSNLTCKGLDERSTAHLEGRSDIAVLKLIPILEKLYPGCEQEDETVFHALCECHAVSSVLGERWPSVAYIREISLSYVTTFFSEIDWLTAQMSNVFVHKHHRKKGLLTRLLSESMELGADCGYKVVRCDATSEYTARACEKLQMQKLAEIPYSSYLSRSLEPVFQPPYPHEALKIYVVINPQERNLVK